MEQKKLKAVLVPLYLKLYEEVAPEIKSKLLPMAESVAAILRESCQLTVLPVTCTPEDVQRAEEIIKTENVDCIITLHLAYSPSLLSADMFANLSKPILVIDTTLDEGFEAMSGDYLLKNHGIHGVMDFASVLRSMGVHYSICAGYYKNEDFRDKLRQGLNLILAVCRYENQKIAITGKPFDMMGDFAVDPQVLRSKFGHTVHDLAEEEILNAMNEVSGDEVDEAYAAEISKYAFNGDAESLKTNIRQYIAFQKIFLKNNISAYTMNFSDFYNTPVPFYAINNLMKNAVGYAGEGDILTASLGKPLNILSEKAFFSEFFCPDWKKSLLIMSHMGETDPRFARQGGKVSIQEKIALGKSQSSYYYKSEAQPMEMTFVTWTKNQDGSLRLLSGLLDCVESAIFEDFGAPHFVAQPKTELGVFLETYSKNGGGHHIYVAQGDILGRLSAFAHMTGVDYCEMH